MRVELLFLLGFLLGCSSTSVNSDSQPGRHSVQCLNVVARCHERARSVCTDGYLVTNRVRPQNVDDDVRYTLNIRCRDHTL